MKPRVFVIHEPLKYNPATGNMVRQFNMSSAKEYGDLVYVLPRGDQPSDNPADVLPSISKAMADYSPHDYIAVVGGMERVIWAACYAACRGTGALNLLTWDNSVKRYVAQSVQLWEKVPNIMVHA